MNKQLLGSRINNQTAYQLYKTATPPYGTYSHVTSKSNKNTSTHPGEWVVLNSKILEILGLGMVYEFCTAVQALWKQ